MKNNKILTVIMVAIVVFAVTTFEVKADLKDYIPDVPAWINRFVNALSDYKDRVLAFFLYRSQHPIIQTEVVQVEDDKSAVMGSANYEEMLDRMKNFVNDSNPQEICKFMQLFVQNYVSADSQAKNIIKKEHDVFNDRLQELRTAGVPWSKIGCLTNLSSSSSNDLLNAWAFFNHLKKFDSMWSKDETLNTAISRIESMIAKG